MILHIGLGIGRSFISALFVQADSLLALIEFADEEKLQFLIKAMGLHKGAAQYPTESPQRSALATIQRTAIVLVSIFEDRKD